MTEAPENRLSRLLQDWRSNVPGAQDAVFDLCYNELRTAAKRIFSAERPGFTMRPTEIVNEAFLRLGGKSSVQWENSRHFFAVFTRAMRRVVIDYARSGRALKRPPLARRCELSDDNALTEKLSIEDAILVSHALEAFEQVDVRRSEVLSLHFYVGLTFAEIGKVVGKREDAVKKDWYVARLWLARYLNQGASE